MNSGVGELAEGGCVAKQWSQELHVTRNTDAFEKPSSETSSGIQNYE